MIPGLNLSLAPAAAMLAGGTDLGHPPAPCLVRLLVEMATEEYLGGNNAAAARFIDLAHVASILPHSPRGATDAVPRLRWVDAGFMVSAIRTALKRRRRGTQ